MGKQQLKSFLKNYQKEELVEQLIELYETSKEVKKYYDFLLSPNEDRLVEQWKAKISKEYFPAYGKRRKARRSIGQKAVKELDFLGVSADRIADVRLFAIEIAVLYTTENRIAQAAFYESFFQQYDKAINFIVNNGIVSDFKMRCFKLMNEVVSAGWSNAGKFEEMYALVFLTRQNLK